MRNIKMRAVILAIVMGLMIQAVGAIELTVGSVSAEKGSEFGVDITLSSTDKIFAGQIDLTFDPMIVEFVRIEKGSYFGAGSLDSSDLGGMVESNGVINNYVAMRALAEEDGVAGSGTFARVIFRAKEIGTSNVRVTQTLWGNSSAQRIVDPNETVNNGAVTVVAAAVCGDGTCSGSESCSSCSGDCGQCSSGGGSPGGSGPRGNGPSGGSPPSEDDENSTLIEDLLALFLGEDDEEQSCSPDWSCLDWGSCVDGTRMRICVDNAGCFEQKTEKQACGEEGGRTDIVIAGFLSVASFVGIVVFFFMWYRGKRVVAAKQAALIESASGMRAQWK
jgi:hypothetical protein